MEAAGEDVKCFHCGTVLPAGEPVRLWNKNDPVCAGCDKRLQWRAMGPEGQLQFSILWIIRTLAPMNDDRGITLEEIIDRLHLAGWWKDLKSDEKVNKNVLRSATSKVKKSLEWLRSFKWILSEKDARFFITEKGRQMSEIISPPGE